MDVAMSMAVENWERVRHACRATSTDSGDRDLLRSPIDFRFRIFLDRGHGLLRAAGHRKLAGSDFENGPCTCLVPRPSPRLSSHIPALSVSIVAHS
jgi:hypothetical protein